MPSDTDRQTSNVSHLPSALHISETMSTYFRETQHPQQKHVINFLPFPSILSPPTPSLCSLSFLTDAIKSNKPFLESLLHKTGAILFRGFAVTTALDFNNVVEAFGFDELSYFGGTAPRTQVVGRVYTANESPPDQDIPFHHEMVQDWDTLEFAYMYKKLLPVPLLIGLPEFPSKLLFYCDVEPEIGGETPLVLSHIVCERMKERHPDFVKRLEEHGLIYNRVLGEEDDPSSPIGRGWQTKFSTNNKTVAEERAAKLGMKLEWLEDGVKLIVGPVQAIKQDKTRNRKIWFMSMVAPHTITFGDGKPLPGDIIDDCLQILEEESVAIPWQKGDVLLIDNWAVLHARRSSSSPRRVLASLCK